ncbi:MAG: hypothetical protein GW875_16810 [Deltaproteobacteria bacterium]|nr:hypothetical protein [Deltaproteobacteria bacterium]NCP03636.1 hypothetical protein [Deltaproteobacteria bacterium]NCP78661.1 hypothetical protein [Desulfuromonadales bacterium]
MTGPAAPVNSGSSIAVSTTMTNIGGERATEHAHVGYYLSTDVTWDSGDSLLGYDYKYYGLTAGESVTFNRNLSLPLGISGTYYIVGKANYNGNVPDESDLTNNTLASTAFTVNP